MKNIILTVILFLCASTTFAQDKIITKDGDVINAYNVDIGSTSVYYKTSEKVDAQLTSIAKDNVLMIKRKDGTKVNLYEEKENSSNPNSAAINQNSSMGNASTASQKMNEEIEARLNTQNPKFTGDLGDKAKNVFCLLGATNGSQFVNDDIEATSEIGRYEFRNGRKASLNKTISKHADNERGDLIFEKIGEENVYNFTNPAMLVKVTNRTNKTIYIDLAKSFFVREDNAKPYYVPSSSTSTTTSGSGAGVNLGAVAGAVGIGGALGTLAGGVNVGGGSSASTSNTVYAQRVLTIPPQTTASLDPQLLFIRAGKYCDGFVASDLDVIEWVPKFFFDKGANGNRLSTGETLNYKEENNPLKFKVILGYSFNEDCSNIQTMSFGYYVRQIIGFQGIQNNNWARTYPDKNCSKIANCIPDYKNYLGFIGHIANGDDIRYYKAGWFSKGN